MLAHSWWGTLHHTYKEMFNWEPHEASHSDNPPSCGAHAHVCICTHIQKCLTAMRILVVKTLNMESTQGPILSLSHSTRFASCELDLYLWWQPFITNTEKCSVGNLVRVLMVTALHVRRPKAPTFTPFPSNTYTHPTQGLIGSHN